MAVSIDWEVRPCLHLHLHVSVTGGEGGWEGWRGAPLFVYHSWGDWMMNATPLWAQMHGSTCALPSVRTMISVTSSALEVLRYSGKAVQTYEGLSPFSRHLSRDGGRLVLKSSQSCRLDDDVEEVAGRDLAPSSTSPSTTASCTPSAVSHPISRYSSKSSKLHLFAFKQ